MLAVLRGTRGVCAARRGAVRLAAGAGAGIEPRVRGVCAVAPFQRLRRGRRPGATTCHSLSLLPWTPSLRTARCFSSDFVLV